MNSLECLRTEESSGAKLSGAGGGDNEGAVENEEGEGRGEAAEEAPVKGEVARRPRQSLGARERRDSSIVRVMKWG